MIDIVALLSVAGPVAVNLISAVFNFVLYLKNKNIHQSVQGLSDAQKIQKP